MEETSGIVTVMEEVEIFTIPALFTPYKVDRESIYPGLHLYEIQARRRLSALWSGRTPAFTAPS